MLSKKEVLAQSESAQRQWGELWLKHAEINGKKYQADKNTIAEFAHKGTGKTLVCCGLAPSFEKKFDLLKKYRANVDIAVVDKALGPCIDGGIIPDMVFLSDAMISYEEWCAPWIGKTENIKLIANITSNPKWSANWKGKVYFCTNKDNINTQDIYAPASGCYELIPASSNVGNTVVVFTTMLMNYDQYLLLGYDFVTYPEDKYYAFKDSDKRYWMKHGAAIDSDGNFGNITQNLLFTCRWLSDFWRAELVTKNVQIFNCSGGTICEIPRANFERKLSLAKKRALNEKEKNQIVKLHQKEQRVIAGPNAAKELQEALQSHPNIGEVLIHYVEPEVVAWLNG